jgi:ApeA N-terminal domain 1
MSWRGVTVNSNNNTKRSGIFTIPSGKEVQGELTFYGPNTSLYLHNKEDFDLSKIIGGCVKGVLHDLTKVTLIDCVPPFGTGYVSKAGGKYRYANVFPHYVVSGDHHISPDDKVLSEVRFIVDDASTLFYDFDTFGTVIRPGALIEQVVQANGVDRKLKSARIQKSSTTQERKRYSKQIPRSA